METLKKIQRLPLKWYIRKDFHCDRCGKLVKGTLHYRTGASRISLMKRRVKSRWLCLDCCFNHWGKKLPKKERERKDERR